MARTYQPRTYQFGRRVASRVAIASLVLVALGGCHDASRGGQRLVRDPNLAKKSDVVVQFHNKYRVPAAYLTPPYANNAPALSVTYPNFLPNGSNEIHCQNWFSQKTPTQCVNIKFLLHRGSGRSQKEVFDQTYPLRNLHDVAEVADDEFGYRVSWSKKGSLNRYYTRGSGQNFIYFACTQVDPATGSLGICQANVPILGGDELNFLFPASYRDQIPQIETKLEKIVATFRID